MGICPALDRIDVESTPEIPCGANFDLFYSGSSRLQLVIQHAIMHTSPRHHIGPIRALGRTFLGTSGLRMTASDDCLHITQHSSLYYILVLNNVSK